MLAIRPARHEYGEYAAMLAVHQALWPEYPFSLEEWVRVVERTPPEYRSGWWVGEVAGQIVAVGSYREAYWAYAPGHYQFDLRVHPAYAGRGIGTALYQQLRQAMAQEEPAPRLLLTMIRDDKAAACHLLAKWGFQPVLYLPTSRLDPATFDPAPYAPLLARLESEGITLHTIAELAAAGIDWQRPTWELTTQLIRDVPTSLPVSPEPFERWQRGVVEAPSFDPHAYFVAHHGEAWVGLTHLRRRADPRFLENGLTGTLPAYRRRGIATALKVRAIAFARHCGAETIETTNEKNNPMFALNLKLGFLPQPSWIEYQKQIVPRT